MTVLITLTTAGADTGPFDLYSDVDGYLVPFETNVPKASLVSGYTSVLVPGGATIIRVMSDSVCTNYIDLAIGITTTTTSSSSSTTSSTTTPVPYTEYRLVSYSSIDRPEACGGTTPLVGQPISVYSSISNPLTSKTLYNESTFISTWTAVPNDGDYVAFYVAGFPATLYVGNVDTSGNMTSIVTC